MANWVERVLRQISATGDHRGFTLLELMLVILVMGMLAVTVSLALPDSAQRNLERDARTLRGQVALAVDQAIYRNRDYGVWIGPDRYRFYRREGETWQAVEAGSSLDSKLLSEATQLRLRMGGQWLDGESDAPQILIVSDGQVTPFELALSHPDATRTQRIEASFAGDLRLSDGTGDERDE
jgi:general secretion pathway protein H